MARVEEFLISSSIFDPPKGGSDKSHGMSIEKKIEILESLAGTVNNRRTRRWLNDRLLLELVPPLNEKEIRGLFAPPPWGDDVPLSPFCMTNVGEWDKFRNIDMDKEAILIKSLERSSMKKKGCMDADKVAVLKAWQRVDGRTREALRRSVRSELIEGYEECIRAFFKDSGNGDCLVLHIQDPFHRLLLHGVCEFYNLASATATISNDAGSTKMTRIKQKSVPADLPNISLSRFLKMSREGQCQIPHLFKVRPNHSTRCSLQWKVRNRWISRWLNNRYCLACSAFDQEEIRGLLASPFAQEITLHTRV